MTKESLLLLHDLLGQFEDHLARKSQPANWGAEGIEEIHIIRERIEKEV